MLLFNFVQKNLLEISFFLYFYATQILFVSSMIGGMLLIRILKKENFGLFVGLGSLFGMLIYSLYFQPVILKNYFDQEIAKENFYYGCMTYYTTTHHQPPRSNKIVYNDYFIINNSFVEVYIRGKNSPISKQVNDFNILLNRNKCYTVRYMEFNFLFYKKIQVYDLVGSPS